MKLFSRGGGGGGEKRPPPPSTQASITKIRETLSMLEKREEFLEKKADAETQKAKQFLARKKRREAMACLKRRKGYEGQIEKISGAKMSLEEQLMAIEGASVSMETMKAMQLGARTMKQLHGHMDIDRVDDTMDEIREQMDIANEIGDAISQSIGGDLIDEDDLEAELAGLMEEDVEETILSMPSTAGLDRLPASSTPTKTASKTRLTEEEELAMLEASMAM